MRVELGDEGVARSGLRRLVGARYREVRREGLARDVRIAGGIDGDGVAQIGVAAAQVGRVAQDRVHGERPLRVEGRDLEAYAVAARQAVVRCDGLPPAVLLLVDDGLVLPEHPAVRMHEQVAMLVQFEFARALEEEFDPAGIGARLQDQVVFDFALAPVEERIDTGIDRAVAHALEVRDIRELPVGRFAEEVIRLVGRLALADSEH